MEWVLCPWAGGNSRDCFRINEVGWGNSQHFLIMVGNHGDITGKFTACTEGKNAANPSQAESGVHSIMKSQDFVIFQSRAQFFTALSLGLGFSNKGLCKSRILPLATPDYHPELSDIFYCCCRTVFQPVLRALVVCQLKGVRTNMSVY